MTGVRYKRILLKISGEAIAGERKYGIDPLVVRSVAEEIADIYELGIEIGIVIGGGNIFRGLAASTKGMDRVSADYMGMLATVINSLALQDSLEKSGIVTRILSAIKMEQVAEPYIRRRAIRHLEKKRIVIFAGGTGNPYFTTDTAAALRAIEIEANVILKGTRVDGVYCSDPILDPKARLFERLSYMEVVEKGLKVLDSTAVTLCMDNSLPIIVFNMRVKHNLKKVLTGEKIGTIVSGVKSDTVAK